MSKRSFPYALEYRGHHFLPGLLPAMPVVIDLGAHRGEFTALVKADFGARGVSLEANPELAARIPETPGFLLVNAAAAGSDGELEFHIDPSNAESSTAGSGVAGAKAVKVKALSFASILALTEAPSVDLVKMDIESAELDLIRETHVEDLRRVGQWSIEFHDFIRTEESAAVLECLNRLRGAGFEIFRFCLTGHKDILAVRSDLLKDREVSPLRLRRVARFCAWRRMVFRRVFHRVTGK